MPTLQGLMAEGLTEEEAKDVLLAHKMQVREIRDAKEQQAALIQR